MHKNIESSENNFGYKSEFSTPALPSRKYSSSLEQNHESRGLFFNNRKIIEDSGLPIIMANTLAEAAEKAVQARNEVVARQG